MKVPVLTAAITLCILLLLSLRLAEVPQRSVSPVQEAEEPQPAPQPVTVEKIFDDNPEYGDREWISVLVTGDVLPARMVNTIATQQGNFRWSFEKTADRLRDADITFINLETPLVNGCQPTQTGMIFCGDPRNIEGLLFAGVDVASFANNHALNKGREGFVETVGHLEQAGIRVVGDRNQPAVIEEKGVRFAFLAYNDVGEQAEVMAAATRERLQQDIEAAKESADVILVQFHWGEEYRRQPTARQRELAHLAVDLGADVVLGNHPHWFQAAEMYQNKFIMYSHGNFVFDQMWSLETRQGIVGEYIFVGSTLVDVVFHPVLIEDYGQPRWLEGEEAGALREEVRRASEELIRLNRDEKDPGRE